MGRAENSTIVFRAFPKPSFPRPASITANSQAAIVAVASIQSCSNYGVVLNTLNRYLRKRREAGSAGAGCGALVAVELSGASPLPGQDTSSALAVVLSGKRRIEVGRGFDAATLARLVTVLERL